MRFHAHQTVLIKSGKYAGIVGTVEEVSAARVAVRIAGVVNGEPVNARPWISPGALEVSHG